jgi:fatty-acyl-CoA synthase
MKTLPDALAEAAGRGVGALVFHLEDGPVELGAAELQERAGAAARRLAARGIGPGDRVGVLGPNRPEWAVWAYATWLAGAALVPLPIPLRVRDPEAFVERVTALVRAAGCRLVLADPRLAFAAPEELVQTWEEDGDAVAELPAPGPRDPAVIQFTSGSTATPKGAVIPHAAVLAQVRGMSALSPTDIAEEVFLGWAPLFHDLGLFLYLVTPIVVKTTGHLLPTERFARDPAEWLRLVGRTRSTVTVGPQSAWSAALSAARRRGEALDLSSVNLGWFAAETIDPAFVERLLEEAPSVRLAPEAIGATYGLAEAVMGVTTTPYGAGIRFHAAPGTGRKVVSCGVPMEGMAVRIADGEVQVGGASLMSGYLGDGPQPFVDGWLRTGDLGYLHDGELYVTGRARDLLIVMGHNYHPEDFEWAAGRVAGVREGRCAAFVDERAERVVLLVEARGGAEPAALARAVRGRVGDAVGAAPDQVAVVPNGTIEKTTSGKIRRGAIRAAYERGEIAPQAVSGSPMTAIRRSSA